MSPQHPTPAGASVMPGKFARSCIILAACAWLGGCSISIGLTNSPPPPITGSGPAHDVR